MFLTSKTSLALRVGIKSTRRHGPAEVVLAHPGLRAKSLLSQVLNHHIS